MEFRQNEDLGKETGKKKDLKPHLYFFLSSDVRRTSKAVNKICLGCQNNKRSDVEVSYFFFLHCWCCRIFPWLL